MLRQWDKALTHFENVKRQNVKVDVLTYNALITALANGGKRERAIQVPLVLSLLQPFPLRTTLSDALAEACAHMPGNGWPLCECVCRCLSGCKHIPRIEDRHECINECVI